MSAMLSYGGWASTPKLFKEGMMTLTFVIHLMRPLIDVHSEMSQTHPQALKGEIRLMWMSGLRRSNRQIGDFKMSCEDWWRRMKNCWMSWKVGVDGVEIHTRADRLPDTQKTIVA